MKENEIDYESLKETTLYYCKNVVDNNALRDWLSDNLKIFYLYKLNNRWKIAIDDEIINIINDEIIEKTAKYEEAVERDGRLYIKINLLKRILSNFIPLKLSNLELDEFNLIKRSSAIEYNDSLNLKSDISNVGYTYIYLEKSKEGFYALVLRIKKKYTVYNKKISVGKRVTLKDALYTLIVVKCKILGLDYPNKEDICTSKLYRYADKLGYKNEEHIGTNNTLSLDYNTIIDPRRKPSTANIAIEKTTNGTGYKNINLRLAENHIYLLFTITKENIKIKKSKRIYTTNDYYVGLKEYIGLYCEIYNIKQPKKIDYKTGINSIIKSNIEIIIS